MRIVRYPLEIVEYQQLQPLWPGRVLSVGWGADIKTVSFRNTLVEPTIDMWCMDNDAARGDRQPPVLGVWIVRTGNPIPQAMFDADALFHGTVDMRPHLGAWHVFSAVIGIAEAVSTGVGEVSTVDEMVDRIRERHAGGR